ncbi:MAG: BspA family leucine-rich repeat surface protein [Bacilli bacterium]|nr:BspA family leucine-rich repeat surface protein [Bacilli bacterium]
MKKNKLYIIISFIVLILSISGSFAWYLWDSTTNTDVSLGICVPEISFIGGETLQGKDLVPTEDRNKGLTKEVEVSLSKTCTEGDSGVMNLYMRLDSLPVGLQEESFVYEVWNDSTMVSSGNFKGKEEGHAIELLTNEVVTSSSNLYKIYIYIDGSMNNPPSMGGNYFRFSLYSEGTGAIYEENTIATFTTPSNSSSPFLNSGLARKDIEAITIVEDNTVPDGIEGIPLSSVEGDDSVMLWYTDVDENTLYEVYIGSENGVVKLNTSAFFLFSYLTNVEYMDLSNLDTSNTTNMSYMFYNNPNLKEVKLSNFDTSNVTAMAEMFWGCKKLTSLDLSSFNTTNVEYMYKMFWECNSLTELNLSNFDTTKVTKMNNMFRNCKSLLNLNISNFNTSNVTDINGMFYGCSSLKSLDLSNFNTESMLDISYMFYNCSSLETINLSKFDTTNVTNMSSMFANCSSLKSIDLSNFNTVNVTNMYQMFFNCNSLTSLDLSNLNFSSLENSECAFYTESLRSVDLSGTILSGITSYSNMFKNNSNLTVTVDSSQVDWLTSRFNQIIVEEA